MNNTYMPWLATSGTWNGQTYTMQIRDIAKWSDGTPLTGADVAYTINLARTNTSDPYHSNVATVTNAVANGNTVTVTFSNPPGYSEFQSYLWRAPVVPRHIWSKLSPSQQITGANKNPVGTGPMTLLNYSATQVAYQTKSNRWGISQLGLKFKFKYLVDVVNGSNNVELSALTAGQIDWSNNYDLALDNNAGLDSTPWSYFQRVYNLPIAKQQTAQLNWERFSSPADWNLVQQAGTTPLTDTARLNSLYSQLEKDFLQQLPQIPVWYNGAWFQGSTKYWTGYPADSTSNEATPVMWGGYLGAMTSVYGLAALRPATAAG